MSAIVRLALSEKALKKMRPPIQISAFNFFPFITGLGPADREDPKNPSISKAEKRKEREPKKLTEEIRNEAPIDGIPEVRRRDSSENLVHTRTYCRRS